MLTRALPLTFAPMVLALASLTACNFEIKVPEDLLEMDLTADLTDTEEVLLFSSASAPGVFISAALPLLTISADQLSGEEVTCPEIVVEGAVTTYTGGCTAEDGVEWFGVAVSDEATGVTYEDFGYTRASEDCSGVMETLSFSGGIAVVESEGMTEFDIDVVIAIEGAEDDCSTQSEVQAIAYEGSQAVSGEVTTWNGSGQYGSLLHGVVEAATVDEVLHDAGCATEAESGTTTLSSGANEVVITYDGATDCAENSTVTWTLNGEEQGELEGVACSSRGGPMGGALLVLAGLVGALRRRR